LLRKSGVIIINNSNTSADGEAANPDEDLDEVVNENI